MECGAGGYWDIVQTCRNGTMCVQYSFSDFQCIDWDEVSLADLWFWLGFGVGFGVRFWGGFGEVSERG